MASTLATTERWLRGPVPAVPAALQPAAHALLQARDELAEAVRALDERQLWVRPGGAAAAGFHALHVAGAVDRLLTYARGEELSAAQRQILAAEREPPPLAADALLVRLDGAVEAALAQLRSTDPATLAQSREVGRARLPSTVAGLLFHAAEHAQRHAGQAVTTAKVVRSLVADEAAVDRAEAAAIADAARALLRRAEERMREQDDELARLRTAASEQATRAAAALARLEADASALRDERDAARTTAATLEAELDRVRRAVAAVEGERGRLGAAMVALEEALRRERSSRHHRLAQAYWRLRHRLRRLLGAR
jgi:hypothetical protein